MARQGGLINVDRAAILRVAPHFCNDCVIEFTSASPTWRSLQFTYGVLAGPQKPFQRARSVPLQHRAEERSVVSVEQNASTLPVC